MNAIEIIEWFDKKDVCTAKVSAGLPAGYYCRISRVDGADEGERSAKPWWYVKTKNGCKPSIRYYQFLSRQDAYDFGTRWAKRQQRELARLTKASQS